MSSQMTASAITPKALPTVFPELMKVKCNCVGGKCDPETCNIPFKWAATQKKIIRSKSGPSLSTILEVDEQESDNDDVDQSAIITNQHSNLTKRHSAPSLLVAGAQHMELSSILEADEHMHEGDDKHIQLADEYDQGTDIRVDKADEEVGEDTHDDHEGDDHDHDSFNTSV